MPARGKRATWLLVPESAQSVPVTAGTPICWFHSTAAKYLTAARGYRSQHVEAPRMMNRAGRDIPGQRATLLPEWQRILQELQAEASRESR